MSGFDKVLERVRSEMASAEGEIELFEKKVRGLIMRARCSYTKRNAEKSLLAMQNLRQVLFNLEKLLKSLRSKTVVLPNHDEENLFPQIEQIFLKSSGHCSVVNEEDLYVILSEETCDLLRDWVVLDHGLVCLQTYLTRTICNGKLKEDFNHDLADVVSVSGETTPNCDLYFSYGSCDYRGDEDKLMREMMLCSKAQIGAEHSIPEDTKKLESMEDDDGEGPSLRHDFLVRFPTRLLKLKAAAEPPRKKLKLNDK